MKVKKPVKTALLLILFAVCLNAAVNHLDVVGRSLAHFFGLLSPILIGFLMAFLLSIPVNALEKRSSNRVVNARCGFKRHCSDRSAFL